MNTECRSFGELNKMTKCIRICEKLFLFPSPLSLSLLLFAFFLRNAPTACATDDILHTAQLRLTEFNLLISIISCNLHPEYSRKTNHAQNERGSRDTNWNSYATRFRSALSIISDAVSLLFPWMVFTSLCCAASFLWILYIFHER